jgi:hypothetical protein
VRHLGFQAGHDRVSCRAAGPTHVGLQGMAGHGHWRWAYGLGQAGCWAAAGELASKRAGPAGAGLSGGGGGWAGLAVGGGGELATGEKGEMGWRVKEKGGGE